MATQFQNRLVGTIILVAVGVILFPEILDGDKERRNQVFASIPLRPVEVEGKEKLPTPEPELKVVQKSQEVAQEEIVQDAQEVAQQTSAQLKGESSVPAVAGKSAWIIQLGTFRNAESVYTLVGQLRKAGFRAYSEPRLPVQGSLNKVFIGPELSRTKLESQLPALHKLTKLDGRVLPFKPLDPGA